MKTLRTYAAELRTSMGFLTVLPVESRREAGVQADSPWLRQDRPLLRQDRPLLRQDSPGLGQSAGWFPWVGLVIGAGAGAVWWLSGLVLPPMLAAVLAVSAWAALTGGLHLDGLADCCDGLLSSAAVERRLEIMRDPRLGTFGAVGLCLVLVAKIAAVYSLPSASTIPAMLLAAGTGRLLILLARWQPAARAGGMGEDFQSGLRGASLPLAAVPVIGSGIFLGWSGGLAVLAALLATLAVFSLAKSRIGGLTGDVLGCALELSELAALLACNLRLPV
ncbi:MAG: cobalamin 5'-phosphate synthase [Chloroflexi bacterium RBG_16_54_18]|nr:MAG: cobalamin 5'-phosphate synthase [Chloroflexi bacterium RBG_16_54_18]